MCWVNFLITMRNKGNLKVVSYGKRYSNLSIIGCAMKIHNTLGNGFQEVIYQRCLAIELSRAGLNFGREVEQKIFYDGIYVGTAGRFCENKIIVELKAQVRLEPVHLAQAKNYVVACNFEKGLLINFGGKSLDHKLIFNPKYNPR